LRNESSAGSEDTVNLSCHELLVTVYDSLESTVFERQGGAVSHLGHGAAE
jgi:hypothetical protein